MVRDLQAVQAESKRNGSLSEWGLSSSLIYGLPTASVGIFESGLRFDYVQGIDEADLEKRWRLSPALTWYPSESRTISLRLQYNLDHTETEGVSHGVWGQVGINWGGGEVR